MIILTLISMVLIVGAVLVLGTGTVVLLPILDIIVAIVVIDLIIRIVRKLFKRKED